MMFKKLILILVILSTLSGCASVNFNSREVFIACRTVDVATTYLAVSKGIGKEVNPAMSALINKGWPHFFAFQAFYMWVILRKERPEPHQKIINTVACAPAAWNITQF